MILLKESRKLQLTISDSLPTEELPSNLHSTLSIPPEVADIVEGEQHVTMAFTVYNSPVLFPVRNASQGMNSSTTVVGSQVVSATVNGIKNGARLTGQVTFSLRLTNFQISEKRNLYPTDAVSSGTLLVQVNQYILYSSSC